MKIKHLQLQYLIELLRAYGYDAWMTYSTRYQLFVSVLLLTNYIARLTNRKPWQVYRLLLNQRELLIRGKGRVEPLLTQRKGVDWFEVERVRELIDSMEHVEGFTPEETYCQNCKKLPQK